MLQVLSFDCYYKEEVEGSQEESQRHRRSLHPPPFNLIHHSTLSTCQSTLARCRLLFHLEDDSLALVEPPQQNSGLVQVCRCHCH